GALRALDRDRRIELRADEAPRDGDAVLAEHRPREARVVLAGDIGLVRVLAEVLRRRRQPQFEDPPRVRVPALAPHDSGDAIGRTGNLRATGSRPRDRRLVDVQGAGDAVESHAVALQARGVDVAVARPGQVRHAVDRHVDVGIRPARGDLLQPGEAGSARGPY